MICPSCGGEPLTRNQFILKPQVLTLKCSRCAASLKMSEATQRTAALQVGFVAMFCAAATFATMVILFRRRTPWTAPLIAALAFAALAVLIAASYWVRTRLWNKDYVKR